MEALQDLFGQFGVRRFERTAGLVQRHNPSVASPTSRRQHQEMNFQRRWKPGSIKPSLSAAGGYFYGMAGADAGRMLALHVLELDGGVMDVEALP